MNRRKSTRLTRRLKVTMLSETRKFKLYTGNVSAGGISVKTLRPLPNDTSVMIELTLPSDDTVSIPGIVKWDFTIPVHGFHKNGMGIQFTERSEQYEAFIRDMYAGAGEVFREDYWEESSQELEAEPAEDYLREYQEETGSSPEEGFTGEYQEEVEADSIAFCTEDYPQTYFEEEDAVTVIRTEHGKITIRR